MPSPVNLLLWLALPVWADPAWRNILEPAKLHPDFGMPVILPAEANRLDPAVLTERVEQGWFAILEGASPAAESLGFRPTDRTVPIRRVIESREPELFIVWEKPQETAIFRTPPEATVFTRERWEDAPLVAGVRKGKGAVLWLALPPGPTGGERFPYLVHALADLGLGPPVSSRRLWLFFDSSYRMRVDPEYMARRWRRNGVAALHIAAWHYWEPDEARDTWLAALIGACHRNRILVYAWLELPHVSERFWTSHPEWREKTALGADAHLDWRKLMNLRHPDCARAVRQGAEELLRRFDWDGVNLAELYFESLEGHENPARFTPLNEQVREEFREQAGFDPGEMFAAGGPRHWRNNRDGLGRFLEYRTGLARRLQQEWIGVIDGLRRQLPHLDLTLTHVDNLLVPETRDRIGADARALLPLLDSNDFTFLVEDPATAWSLGPERYPKLAAEYRTMVKNMGRVAIDINVVERYQDVYPTKQQVGIEVLRETHLAAAAFARVALYFETSIRKTDWGFLGPALAPVSAMERRPGSTHLIAAAPVLLRWDGPALVNGALWPAQDGPHLLLPAGEHTVEHAPADAPLRLLDLNAELEGAWVDGAALRFAYRSTARALALLSRPPRQLRIDGKPVEPRLWLFGAEWVLVLPKGQHIVSIHADSGV